MGLGDLMEAERKLGIDPPKRKEDCPNLAECKAAAAKGIMARCVHFGHWERCKK